MPPESELLASLGLEQLIDKAQFRRAADGTLLDPLQARVVFSSAQAARGLRHVAEQERAGAWHRVMKSTGHSCGGKIAAKLDARLASLGKPALAALPLEACLVFIEHYLAAYGWGRFTFDLSDAAEHGLVVARLEHSFFAETLSPTNDFVDPLLAGILLGFIEHISGQTLGCEELACARHGAPPCLFVITAAERLATVTSRIGHDSADALLASLRT